MELKHKGLPILETTLKTTLEFLKDNRNQIIKIDPDFAIKNKLLGQHFEKGVMKQIINSYGRFMREKLLRGESYCIASTTSSSVERKLVFLQVKQVEKGKGYCGRLKGIQKFRWKNLDLSDCLIKPTLRLTVEITGNHINRSKVVCKAGFRFGNSLSKVPVKERYKFAK